MEGAYTSNDLYNHIITILNSCKKDDKIQVSAHESDKVYTGIWVVTKDVFNNRKFLYFKGDVWNIFLIYEKPHEFRIKYYKGDGDLAEIGGITVLNFEDNEIKIKLCGKMFHVFPHDIQIKKL